MDKDALMERDLYELFGLAQKATDQEIKKAYRKKALTCHPDKNPDNPNAVKLFLELSTALEILISESSRAVYDKLLSGRQAAKIRHDALDSHRKKLKEDLEAREKLSARSGGISGSRNDVPESKLLAEIERLRKEGSKQLLEEMQKVNEQLREEILNYRNTKEEDGSAYRLKVRWKSDKTDENNGGYNTEKLKSIFSKYGDIACLIVSQKKNGSALLEFESKSAAVKAYQLEKGFGNNQLTLSWLTDPVDLKMKDSFVNSRCTPLSECRDTNSKGLFPSFNSTPSPSSSATSSLHKSQINADEDFEATVLAKLREAQRLKESPSC